jgi:hypothetical protein
MHDRFGAASTGRIRPDPNTKLVRIFDTEHESEALVVNGLLDSMGIDSDITSIEAVQGTFPGVGGTVILVRAADADRARRIIEDSQRYSLEVPAEMNGA